MPQNHVQLSATRLVQAARCAACLSLRSADGQDSCGVLLSKLVTDMDRARQIRTRATSSARPTGGSRSWTWCAPAAAAVRGACRPAARSCMRARGPVAGAAQGLMTRIDETISFGMIEARPQMRALRVWCAGRGERLW